MAFVNDERNIGGRKYIYTLLYNHKKALNYVKPIVNSSVPPKAHVKAGSEYFGDTGFGMRSMNGNSLMRKTVDF